MEYKIGDFVQLVSTRPDYWATNGEMDCFLNNIVELTTVNIKSNRISFSDENAGSWSFQYTDIARIATKEEADNYIKINLELEEKEKIRIKEIFKNLVYLPEDIYKLAADIFGEDRVDIVKSSEFITNIIIHFPEINITNSRNQNHLIKDLYVKFNIDIKLRDFVDISKTVSKGLIYLFGIRQTYSLKEYESRYNHSHLSSGISDWSRFCLGSSVFNTLIENVKITLSEEDWNLMFLSLENYLSWESIEGGPYFFIQDMKYRENISNVKIAEELNRILKDIPSDLWEFNNGLKIIPRSLDLYNFF